MISTIIKLLESFLTFISGPILVIIIATLIRNSNISYVDIIEYINKLTGMNFRSKNESKLKKISSILNAKVKKQNNIIRDLKEHITKLKSSKSSKSSKSLDKLDCLV